MPATPLKNFSTNATFVRRKLKGKVLNPKEAISTVTGTIKKGSTYTINLLAWMRIKEIINYDHKKKEWKF